MCHSLDVNIKRAHCSDFYQFQQHMIIIIIIFKQITCYVNLVKSSIHIFNFIQQKFIPGNAQEVQLRNGYLFPIWYTVLVITAKFQNAVQ